MAQPVRVHSIRNAVLFPPETQSFLNSTDTQSPPLLGNKHGRLIEKARLIPFFQPVLQSFDGLRANRADAIFITFPSDMNQLITKRLLGHVGTQDEAPIVLDEYANTASAGSIIAFNLHHQDLKSGDMGVICSFGAGYSIGSLALRKR